MEIGGRGKSGRQSPASSSREIGEKECWTCLKRGLEVRSVRTAPGVTGGFIAQGIPHILFFI